MGKVIIFIDEIDSLAQSREREMHEATRRMLSVFLRHLDGFDSSDDTIVICATNRRKDLDPAL
jgi:ATP-dependent 26S proteasome regulatory subunit